MSSTKLDKSGVFHSLPVAAPQTQLSLPPHAVRIRKNGIEFRSSKPLPVMKEMTVELQSPGETKRVNFSGVIVDCVGNRHTGYLVSMVFTSMNRQAHERLNFLANSARA